VLAGHISALTWNLEDIDFTNCGNILATPAAKSFTQLQSLNLRYLRGVRSAEAMGLRNPGFITYTTRLLLNSRFPALETLTFSLCDLSPSDIVTLANTINSPILSGLANFSYT
jgi:hypothetical protein